MKVSEMTPEQIRVRVAEIEGWTNISNCPFDCPNGIHQSDPNVAKILPDYTNSIDAINVAVLRMTSELQYVWFRQLRTDLHNDIYDYADCTENNFRVATASALNRAKAFVSIHEK